MYYLQTMKINICRITLNYTGNTMSCELYQPLPTYRQLDSNGGSFFHLISGGCGRTTVDMKIGKRYPCTKSHHCLGVHNISINFYSRWMGSDAPTDDKTKGILHMISESYGIVTLYQSKLLKSHPETTPDNESPPNDNKITSDKTIDYQKLKNNIFGADDSHQSNDDHNQSNDNTDDVPESDSETDNEDTKIDDPEDYEMYDYKSPYILRAQIVFMSHPTPSPFEAGIKDWYGMGGQWNMKNDVLLILSDESKHFGQTIELERIDNTVIDIPIQQPEASKPMYDITFYFDSPVSISNNVQTILIDCILKSKPFPESIEHEDFVDDISALHLFGGGWIDTNKRVCATFVKSSDMLNDKFDSSSRHLLMSKNDLSYARMQVEDVRRLPPPPKWWVGVEWLLAWTSVEPTEMVQLSEQSDSIVKFRKIDVMWKSIIIGYVCAVYKVAKQGNITLTLIKKN